MGSWLHSKGHWAEAQAYLNSHLSLCPNSELDCVLTQGLFEAAHKLRPFPLLPKISLTEVYAQTGNAPKAMRLLEQLPQSLARRQLGELVATNGDTLQNLRVMVTIAMLMHQRGLLKEAEEQYRRAIAALENHDTEVHKHSAPLMHMNHGIVCHRLDLLEEARAGYDKAIELMPKLSMFVRYDHIA